MKKALTKVSAFHTKILVPEAGLEPARLAAVDFESTTSTSSITRATLFSATTYMIQHDKVVAHFAGNYTNLYKHFLRFSDSKNSYTSTA